MWVAMEQREDTSKEFAKRQVIGDDDAAVTLSGVSVLAS